MSTRARRAPGRRTRPSSSNAAGRSRRFRRTNPLTAAEKAEWRKALAPVRKDVEGRVGKEVLNAVDKESAALGIK